MSFGGPVKGGRRAGSPGSVAGGRIGQRAENGQQRDDDENIDWERVVVFGTGIAIGAVFGAGVALLFAPASGEEARAAIVRRGARLAKGGQDAWEELRDELEWAARRGKRRVGRRVQRTRWAAEDFIDDRKRPGGWWSKRREATKDQPSKEVEIDDREVQEIVDALC